MNRIKLLIIGLLVFWLSGTDSLAQDRLTGILKQEMEKQMRELKDKEYPPLLYELQGDR